MKTEFDMSVLSLAIIASLLLVVVYAQPPEILWDRTYGGDDGDWAYSVQQTTDGGYVFAGMTISSPADSFDMYLVKTDQLGDTQWTRIYGGSDYDDARSVQQTSDGGYILAGRTMSFGLSYNNMYVVKTDSCGDTIWTRTYGGVDTDIAYAIQQTSDGGYIIAGETRQYAGAVIKIYLVKTDSVGDTLWYRTYEHNNGWLAYSVQQTSDGGYIIAANDAYYSGVEYNIYLLKTDSLGDSLWTCIYGGINDDFAGMVQQTTDGGYIVAGWIDSFGAGYGDFYAIKTDSLGDTLWTRTYGGSSGDGAYSVKQTPDGGYILAGVTYSFGAVNGKMYLVRTNEQGDTLWTIVYCNFYAGAGYSIDLTTDGGYIVAGVSGEEGSDAWLVKTGPDTSSTHAPSIEWVSHPTGFALHPAYPNPFNPVTMLSYSLPSPSQVNLSVYNITGQRVMTLINGRCNAGDHTLRFDASCLSSGMYFARLQSKSNLQVQKIVLVR